MIGSDARRLVDRWPDRFGFFATLPLPDVDAAVVEASRVLDDWVPTESPFSPTTGHLPPISIFVLDFGPCTSPQQN
jgi:hypothetical protein